MDLPDALDLSVPFDQKWEILKPTIERLYVHEEYKLPDLMQIMNDQYGFAAAEHQYKYHINKKWKLKKNLPTSKKAALCQQIKKRAQLGKSSVITRDGKNVDTKNLRRYLKTEARKAITLRPVARVTAGDALSLLGHSIPFGNRIFMNWNMPYGTIRSLAPSAVDHTSPLSDINVTTPPSAGGAPSPTAVAIKAMEPINRARLFVEGRHSELLSSMDKQQKITMSTWMYQFWLFSYKTAKHWGWGPQDWTADILGFDTYHQRTTISISSPSTPGTGIGTPASQFAPGVEGTANLNMENAARWPSSLCRWSIHCKYIEFETLPSPPRSPPEAVDMHDEQTWPVWSASDGPINFTEQLCDNLESNKFSNIEVDKLPIPANQIADAARRSPEELAIEALGFIIMGRNMDLLSEHLEADAIDLDSSGLYPFHLAVSYLDGAKTCCNLFVLLIHSQPLSLRKLYVNDLGHTILDQLMIAILKAHTSCLPSVVDVRFKKDKRFAGEDVDICGRWDADSDCIRTLLASGTASIPFEWKHMFCHTSIQTICHCIRIAFGPRWGPEINTPSGLFLRHCSSCGLKLQLFPLHTLVLVGHHLCQSGCKDENLFGILACLLCMLSNGANPLLKATISIQALLTNDGVTDCNHEELDPAEFAERLFVSSPSIGSGGFRIGWQVVCQVLKRSRSIWNADEEYFDESDSSSESGDSAMRIGWEHSRTSSENEMSVEERSCETPRCIVCCDGEDHIFGRSKVLASLWASTQTELLTYRRLQEGDGWISPNFDMNALNESLERGNKLDIALLRNEMMKPYCPGGEFPNAKPACPILEDVAAYYFSNLEDWNRSTFLLLTDERVDIWGNEWGLEERNDIEEGEKS